MPKLTIKKIESLIKRKEFGRHPDGNQPEPLREIPPMQIVVAQT